GGNGTIRVTGWLGNERFCAKDSGDAPRANAAAGTPARKCRLCMLSPKSDAIKVRMKDLTPQMRRVTVAWTEGKRLLLRCIRESLPYRTRVQLQTPLHPRKAR